MSRPMKFIHALTIFHIMSYIVEKNKIIGYFLDSSLHEFLKNSYVLNYNIYLNYIFLKYFFIDFISGLFYAYVTVTAHGPLAVRIFVIMSNMLRN